MTHGGAFGYNASDIQRRPGLRPPESGVAWALEQELHGPERPVVCTVVFQTARASCRPFALAALGQEEDNAVTAKELLEKRGHIVHQMQELVKKTGEEDRAMTPEERQKFEEMDRDQESLRERAADLSKAEGLVASLEEAGEPRRIEPEAPQNREPEGPGIDPAEAFRVWCLAGTPEVTPERLEAAYRSGLNPLSNTLTFQLHRGFRSAPRNVFEARKRRVERRDLSVGTTTAGGHTVPDEMMGPLEEALLAYGGVRQAATVLVTDTGADLPIPTANDTSNTGEILGENTQANEADMTFGQLVLQSFKYSSKLVQVSVELLQDSSVNVAAFLGEALGTRIGRITNTHFTTGDASSKPNGIVTAAADSSVTAAAAAALTYPELLQLKHSVDPAYRGVGAGWMFNDTTLRIIKSINDASSGRPIWMPGLVQGEPDLIDGHPYYINQDMADGTGTKAVLFGQLDKYIVREARGITLLRLNERYADYHQVGFLAFARYDGDLLNAGTNPVKYLTMG